MNTLILIAIVIVCFGYLYDVHAPPETKSGPWGDG